MNLIKILTAPASERYDTMMKVIDHTNKMQAAIVKKAEKIGKGKKQRERVLSKFK
jgi:hypothetical protein